MTESDWLSIDDPAAMLAHVRPKASDRKLRLFAAACCRSVWDQLTDPRSRRAVEVAELAADGDGKFATDSEVEMGAHMADNGRGPFAGPHWAAQATLGLRSASEAAQVAVRYSGTPPAAQAALLREVFGNPWRTMRCLISSCPRCGGTTSRGPEGIDGPRFCYRCPGDVLFEREIDGWLAWNNGTVPRIAEAIYKDRRWGDMPILADALQDAGCEDEELIAHCQGKFLCPGCSQDDPDERWYGGGGGWCAWCDRSGPELHWVTTANTPNAEEERKHARPHARGCWALDLLLGKE